MADYGYGVCDITRRFQSLALREEINAAGYFASIVGNYFDFIFLTSTDTDIVKIRSSFQSISAIYRSSLRGTNNRPDWSDKHNRLAYILRFFSMHAYLVYVSLRMSLTTFEHSWIRKYCIRVCGLGGGPGSDLVGLVKFLRDSNIFPSLLECTIGDLYPDWVTDWTQIKSENQNEFPFSVTYLHGDLTAKNSCLSTIGLDTIRSADMITMIKSFSTIAAFMRKDAAHGDLLREIFREMKPGALVLYIDNEYSNQHEEFRGIARSGGVSECLFEWHGTITMPNAGQCSSVHRFAQAIAVNPMDRCNVSIMLLRKPDVILGPRRGAAFYGLYRL